MFSDFQKAYEGEIWCLCTVTFGQKNSKLNGRPVYCSWLYGSLKSCAKTKFFTEYYDEFSGYSKKSCCPIRPMSNNYVFNSSFSHKQPFFTSFHLNNIKAWKKNYRYCHVHCDLPSNLGLTIAWNSRSLEKTVKKIWFNPVLGNWTCMKCNFMKILAPIWSHLVRWWPYYILST